MAAPTNNTVYPTQVGMSDGPPQPMHMQAPPPYPNQGFPGGPIMQQPMSQYNPQFYQPGMPPPGPYAYQQSGPMPGYGYGYPQPQPPMGMGMGMGGMDMGHSGNPLTRMAGSMMNQLNPNAFAHSGIPGMSSAPEPMLMPLPPMPGVPMGLELLLEMSDIVVKQKAEFLEIMSGYETANRYNILNGAGQKMYFAGETTSMGALCCGGADRPFKITIVDFSGRPVLLLERPCDPKLYLSSCFCCFGTIGGQVSIKLADGTLLGEIKHRYGCYQPRYDILDGDGQLIMKIEGPTCADCCCCASCTADCCCTSEFPFYLTDGTKLGDIKKKWSFQEMFTDADNFGVSFPKDLDVKWKAIMMGAVFLMDFMYFERNQQRTMQPQFGFN